MVLSPILFLTGAGFAFYVLFPVAFKFFIELNLASTVPAVIMPAMRDYLSFTIGLLKIFGIAFQLPLVLVLVNRIGIIVVVVAILTPPDIVSQMLLALPMWGLFEISLLFMRDGDAPKN